MRRLVKGITSRSDEESRSSKARDLTGMKAADLRALAAQLRQEIRETSAALAQVETQIALGECGRVRGRARYLQQRFHPPILRNPKSGRDLGDDLQIFHDCDISDLVVRQRRSSGGTDEAPFPLEIDVYHFEGNFLSIVQNLPGDLVNGISDQDLLEISFSISSESDCEIFLRLNVQHGPNESTLTRSCRTASHRQTQSFDLSEAELSHRSVDRIWIDLIFSEPAMNRITIGDFVVRRRPRAQV